MNKVNFNKGSDFEQYVIDNIFPIKYYDIIELSHDYNGKYFVESNLKPDIKFRCKQTKTEFWIECKYISKPKHDNYIKNKQLIRYFDLKEPVFYIFGSGINPLQPKYISVIPLNRLYSNVTFYKLFDHKVPNSFIKNFNELKALIGFN